MRCRPGIKLRSLGGAVGCSAPWAVSQAPTQLYICSLSFSVSFFPFLYFKTKQKNPPRHNYKSTNSETYNNQLPARYIGIIVEQVLWEYPATFWLDLGSLHESEPVSDTPKVAKGRRVDKPRRKSARDIAITLFLMSWLYSNRPVSHWTHIRETSSLNRWELAKRSTTESEYVQRVRGLEHSVLNGTSSSYPSPQNSGTR